MSYIHLLSRRYFQCNEWAVLAYTSTVVQHGHMVNSTIICASPGHPCFCAFVDVACAFRQPCNHVTLASPNIFQKVSNRSPALTSVFTASWIREAMERARCPNYVMVFPLLSLLPQKSFSCRSYHTLLRLRSDSRVKEKYVTACVYVLMFFLEDDS